VVIAMNQTSQAQTSYVPSAENLKAREWFQDARFGLFIHWGIYSILGDGEWVMHNRKIRADEYEKLADFFNPIDFDAAEWVALAKAAGMKYITITSKHHDGFAMFDSKVSDWDIVDRTPYKKDVLKALADECHRQGVKLFFYHSELDWHHPDFYPRGGTGQDAGRPDSGDFNKYLDYQDAQLKELLTNYGEIAGIWFDGFWDRPDANWKLDRTYKLIHSLQPQALIGNNHHRPPNPGEDFQMWERDLPGANTSGFGAGAHVSELPLETCDTINANWGFNIIDRAHKSTRELVHYLVRAAGNNANLLLNVGPMPNGKIQPEFVTRLKEVGAWTQKYGESIYATRGGPVPPQPWGVTTQKENRVFVHLLDAAKMDGQTSAPMLELALPLAGKTVRSAKLMGSETKIDASSTSAGISLRLPRPAADEIDQVTVLELAQ
jgi:alpha-L-fucosidase